MGSSLWAFSDFGLSLAISDLTVDLRGAFRSSATACLKLVPLSRNAVLPGFHQ